MGVSNNPDMLFDLANLIAPVKGLHVLNEPFQQTEIDLIVYESLTLASRHLKEGLHQISTPNSKVLPTGHVWHSYRTCLVCTSIFHEILIPFTKLDQIDSD